MDIDEIDRVAKKEIKEEKFREAVEKRKEYLRTKKTLWNKIFPYKIIIIRKEK